MNIRIAKGALVLVKTTNGGEIIAFVDQTYIPTYSIAIRSPDGVGCIIDAQRIRSVQELPPEYTEPAPYGL